MNALSYFIFLFAVGTGFVTCSWLDFHYPKWRFRIRPKLRIWWQAARPLLTEALILLVAFAASVLYCVLLAMLTPES